MKLVRFALAVMLSLFTLGCSETQPTPPNTNSSSEAKSAQNAPAKSEPAQVAPAVTSKVTPAETTSNSAPAKVREPEVLLSSRDKSQQLLIIAIDFAGTPAMDKSLGLEARRQYVAEHVTRLYVQDFAKKESSSQKVKVFALGVPNRDDYLRGDFKNTDELAICETNYEQLTDELRTAVERLGNVDWRAALK
ncbi:MAG: hypothetical protein JNM18_03620 [Planctomycetaceae bacterium]|nr:hypothetical protein [Planctomycetaceae bacterium]